MNEALTVNEHRAKRSTDIHWPNGFHPEQADLFAHSEIRRRFIASTTRLLAHSSDECS
jgi:hypothetical protein